MSLRAEYQQVNNYGTLDRIEIYDSEFTGDPIEFTGRFPLAFDFEHREVTSEQKEYLSLFENPIIMGVLDLYLRVDSTAKETFITDLADAPTKQFRIEWKRDGTKVWEGYPYGRVVEFPERPQYNVKIQFRDFEVLKGIDFPLEDERQKIIEVITRIIDEAGYDNTIYTADAWDHLQGRLFQTIYQDTFPLREYSGSGFTTDQNISYYEALLRCLDPMLVLYQYEGFQIRQISALKDPTDVRFTKFINGSQDTFTLSADLSYSVHATSDQTPNATVATNNTSYPPLRKAVYEYEHRSGSSNIEFDTVDVGGGIIRVDFNDRKGASATEPFSGNGDERLFIDATYRSNDENNLAIIGARAGEFLLDSDESWKRPNDHSQSGTTVEPADIDTETGDILVGQSSVLFRVDMPVMLQGDLPSNMQEDATYYVSFRDAQFIRLSETVGGADIIPDDSGTGTIGVNPAYIAKEVDFGFNIGRSQFELRSDDIPAMTDTSIEVSLMIDLDTDNWSPPRITIINPSQAGESIEYRLTQENIYPDEFRLNKSYFGDGPYQYSKSSYRFSENLSDVTGSIGDINNNWRRKGDTAFTSYSRMKLNEVMDYQRVRQLKKNFRINGEFDPTLVTVYKGDPYMYVGGSYNGKWNPVMVKIEENRA